MIPIRFIVIAEDNPVPQGSMTAMPIFKGKGPERKFLRANVVPSNQKKLTPWREAVAAAAEAAYRGELIDQPVAVHIDFYFKPNGTRSPGDWAMTEADIDKLERAILDGITGTIVKNDARVCRLMGEKIHCEPHEMPRAEVTVSLLPPNRKQGNYRSI